MTTLTLFCWELIMRSNFSKFGAASKHVLAMCARHEHATSHHTPAKIDMILCAGCISKVPSVVSSPESSTSARCVTSPATA